MKQSVARRKSYRPVIAGLKTQLEAKLTKQQQRHYDYLLGRANQAEAKRQQLRRRHRRMVRTSRRANRAHA